MFGLVSKRKYRELDEQYWKAVKECESFANKYSDLERKLKSLETKNMARGINEAFWEGIANSYKAMLGVIRKENEELQTELEEYKRKFADELEKRLALAERLKKLEEGNGEGA